MTRAISYKEYNENRKFLGIGLKSGLIATATGLAGIAVSAAISHFCGPEHSQLAKEIMHYSRPVLVAGGFSSYYLGGLYMLHPPLSGTSKQE